MIVLAVAVAAKSEDVTIKRGARRHWWRVVVVAISGKEASAAGSGSSVEVEAVAIVAATRWRQ